MKTLERIFLFAGSLANVLMLIILIVTDLFSFPSSIIIVSLQIASIFGIAVLIVLVWRAAFNQHAESKWKNILLITCLIAIMYAGWIGTLLNNSLTTINQPVATSDQPVELYSQVSNVAWNAFDKKQYNLAVSVTDICINTYESEATKIQQGLIAINEPESPVETRVDELTKNKINSHGALNDVAACYHVKALAMENLGLMNEAATAYKNAQKYPHARVFDPKQNWYWSPAQTATKWLAQH